MAESKKNSRRLYKWFAIIAVICSFIPIALLKISDRNVVAPENDLVIAFGGIVTGALLGLAAFFSAIGNGAFAILLVKELDRPIDDVEDALTHGYVKSIRAGECIVLVALMAYVVMELYVSAFRIWFLLLILVAIVWVVGMVANIMIRKFVCSQLRDRSKVDV